MFDRNLLIHYPVQVALARSITVLFVLRNDLYCEGIRRLKYAGEGLSKKFSFHDPQTIKGLSPDIVVTDENSLRGELFTSYPEARIVLVDDGLSAEELRTAASQFSIQGILSPRLGCWDFQRALEKIHFGEFWIEPDIAWQLLLNSPARPRSFKDTKASAREREVIGFVCSGFSNKEIAEQLRLSEHTVKAHLNNIYRKFHISNRIQLVTLFQSEKN